jgi:hypothetical protein
MTNLLYCGRMDDHTEHNWPGRKVEWYIPTGIGTSMEYPVVVRTTYHCKGTPVSEGAAPCMDCGNPTANGGPRCIPCAVESARHESEKDDEYWS